MGIFTGDMKSLLSCEKALNEQAINKLIKTAFNNLIVLSNMTAKLNLHSKLSNCFNYFFEKIKMRNFVANNGIFNLTK